MVRRKTGLKIVVFNLKSFQHFIFQLSPELRLVSSHIIGVSSSRLTVLPSLGHVAAHTGSVLHVDGLKHSELNTETSIETCQHDPTYWNDILGLVVEEEEFFAVSCSLCQDIKLVEPETGKMTVAYQGAGDYVPWLILCGDPERLWMYPWDLTSVLELNCSKKTFTHTGRTVRFDNCTSICYLPPPHSALVAAHRDPHRITAKSCETGSVLWSVHMKQMPGPVVFALQYEVLLIQEYGRLLALKPTDGSVIRTFSFPGSRAPKVMGVFQDLLVTFDDARYSTCSIDIFTTKQPLGQLPAGIHVYMHCFDLASVLKVSSTQITSFICVVAVFFPTGLCQMFAAYKEALKDGKARSYRARMNIIGHSGAGKTTLTRKLLGKSFTTKHNSTDGIETHLIKMDLQSGAVAKVWRKCAVNPDDILSDFNNEVATITCKIPPQSLAKDTVPNKERRQEIPSGKAQTQKKGNDTTRISEKKQQTEDDSLPVMVDPVTMESFLKLQAKSKKYTPRRVGKIRLWDFGGQTEFYTTHHLFLDGDALNTIVLDISKDLKVRLRKSNEGKDLTVGIPNTQEDFLSYWLNTIQAKAAQQQILPEIIVVLTHKDLMPQKDKKKYEEDYITEVLKIVRKHGLSKLVPRERVYVLDNKSGSEKEFAQLRRQIMEIVEVQTVRVEGRKVKLWGLERPARWLRLEADLVDIVDKKTQKVAKHVTRQQVKQLASPCGIGDAELESLLVFYHLTGDFLYFFPEDKLREVVVTDPQWLVDAFKSLIAPGEFFNKASLREDVATLLKHGRVTESGLERFWKAKNITLQRGNDDVQFLIELLIKFNLLIPLSHIASSERWFLVPCMLPHKEVHLEETASFKNRAMVLRARYMASHDQLFPMGTFSRFVGQCSKTWQILEDDQLSYTFASFNAGDGLILALTHPHGSSVSVCIGVKRGADRATFWASLLALHQEVQDILGQCFIPPTDRFEIICPHSYPEEDKCHLVFVDEAPNQVELLKPVGDKCQCHGKILSPADFAKGESGNIEK